MKYYTIPISQTNNPRFDNALDHIVAFIFSIRIP